MADTKQFLERFNRWKNGAPIQELYNAGRPVETFEDGKDPKLREEDPGLKAAFQYAISLKLDEFNEGKDKEKDLIIEKIRQEAPLSYGQYYDTTGDYRIDGALARYNGGKSKPVFDDNEAIEYIGQLENANKVGLKNGIWRTPKISGYDPYQIGMGLDTRYEHNPIVYNYLKSKNRLDDPWLTEKEELDLRMQTWKQKKKTIDKFVQQYGDRINQLGYNRAAGMLWHGHPYKMMNTPDSITGKAFLKSIEDGDQGLTGAFNAYYGYKDNAKRYKDRVNRDTAWTKSHQYAIPQEYNIEQDVEDFVKQNKEVLIENPVSLRVDRGTKDAKLIQNDIIDSLPYISKYKAQKRFMPVSIPKLPTAIDYIENYNRFWNNDEPILQMPR